MTLDPCILLQKTTAYLGRFRGGVSMHVGVCVRE